MRDLDEEYSFVRIFKDMRAVPNRFAIPIAKNVKDFFPEDNSLRNV